MSQTFQTNAHTRLVLPADYTPSTYIVQAEQVTLAEDTWDEMRLSVWGFFPGFPSAEYLAGVLPLGTALEDVTFIEDAAFPVGKWFFQGGQLKQAEAQECFEGELLFKGCADVGRPYKMTIDAAGREFEAKNIKVSDGVTIYGPFAKLRSVEPGMTLTVAYPVFGTAPATASVGTVSGDTAGFPGTIPYEPALRDFWWVEVSEDGLTTNWPNGWWKDRMPVECLAGVDPAVAHFVTDHWKHDYTGQPG